MGQAIGHRCHERDNQQSRIGPDNHPLNGADCALMIAQPEACAGQSPLQALFFSRNQAVCRARGRDRNHNTIVQ